MFFKSEARVICHCMIFVLLTAAACMQVPTQQNVRYIPPASEIGANSTDKWALYPGSWGAGNLFLSKERTLICYFDNFTRSGAAATYTQHSHTCCSILAFCVPPKCDKWVKLSLSFAGAHDYDVRHSCINCRRGPHHSQLYGN